MLYLPDRRIFKPPTGVGLGPLATLANGLVGFIPLNEMAGKPRCLPTGFLGTLGGTVPPVWSPRDEPSILISPTSASSAVANINFGTPASLQDLHLAPFTVAARIHKIVSQNSGGITERNDAIKVGWAYLIGNSNLPRLRIGFNTTSSTITSTVACPTGKFVTIATAWDGTLAGSGSLIYIDGVAVGVSAAAGVGTQSSDAADTFYVGRNQLDGQGTGAFSGWISWVALWNRQLNPGEMALVTSERFSLFLRNSRVRDLATTIPFDPSTMAWEENEPFEQVAPQQSLRNWFLLEEIHSAQGIVPPPVIQVPDDLHKFDATWTAFQRDDLETHQSIPPPPPTAEFPEDIQKLDVNWRAQQHDDTDSQSAKQVVPPVTSTLGLTPEELVKFDANWKARQYDEREMQRYLAPTGPQNDVHNALGFFAGVGGPDPAPKIADIISTDGTSSFTATPNVPWLTVTPGTGPIPTAMVVKVSIAGLAPGVYRGKIRLS